MCLFVYVYIYIYILHVCRYCWPYFDKKQEQEFRKVCTNWITMIAKVRVINKSIM